MRPRHVFDLCSLCLISILVLAGCPQPNSSADSGAVDASPDAAPTSDGGGGGRSALGVTCGAASECVSGFCVDGVCCDGACDDECQDCRQPGAEGICSPIRQAEDLIATFPCTGASWCVVDATGVPACKLKDKQPCTANDQCGSGFCLTFFVDDDRDGYGVASSALSMCDAASAAPPAGHVPVAGDCCDSDSRANPGLAAATYHTTPDACGSYDWNCDGVVQRQTTMPCPPTGATVACGASCYIVALGTSTKLFTQACR